MKKHLPLAFSHFGKLRGHPSPWLPLGNSSRLGPNTYTTWSTGYCTQVVQCSAFNVCCSHGLRCKWHPGVAQYKPAQPDVMALIVPRSGQATPWFSSRPLIGWVRSILILLFSNNTAVKTETNEIPKRIWVSIFPITLNMHSSPTWVPLKLAQAPWGTFLPSFTCYPGIIGLKLITGSLIMGPIDSVFQLREAIKKFTLINQG